MYARVLDDDEVACIAVVLPSSDECNVSEIMALDEKSELLDDTNLAEVFLVVVGLLDVVVDILVVVCEAVVVDLFVVVVSFRDVVDFFVVVVGGFAAVLSFLVVVLDFVVVLSFFVVVDKVFVVLFLDDVLAWGVAVEV